jgi:diacylglycerol kinase family enzyme
MSVSMAHARNARSRWLARTALLAGLAAFVVLLVGAAQLSGVLLTIALGVVASLLAIWWFLSRRGVVRLLAAVLLVAAVVTVCALVVVRGALWEIVVVAGLLVVAAVAGRAALTDFRDPEVLPERESPVASRPYLIMNPRSGGGKVGIFDLDHKAEQLGAEVALLSGSTHIDVEQLAVDAVVNGADLLGVAGGDGTQALVAGAAAEHGVQFLVLSAGTRNHFALDLGLDRERPDLGLDALRDGVEVLIDLGRIGDRTFVNNASFGAYAEVVQSPSYREDKVRNTLDLLPDLLTGRRGARLVVRVDDEIVIEAPQAVLVSNNPYEFSDIAGLGRRARLDGGRLGVIAVRVDNAFRAAALVRGIGEGVRRLEAHEVVVDADADQIPVGIDGEAVMMPTPVRCTILPGALRVRLPRNRPGSKTPKPALDMTALVGQALGTVFSGPRGRGDTV